MSAFGGIADVRFGQKPISDSPLTARSGHSDEDQLRSGSARIDVMRVSDLSFDHRRRKESLATMRALSSQNHDDVVKPQP